MNDQDWLNCTSKAELINISDTERLLELLRKGFYGEIHLNYPTIHTLKCFIQDDGVDLIFSSG